MPQAQFYDVETAKRLTAKMNTPKRITKIDAWFKAARKVIKEIPELTNGWSIFRHEASREYVRFDLHHSDGRKAYVVIQRNTLLLG